jgi:ribonuclease Y
MMGKKAVDLLKFKDVPAKIIDLFGRFDYRTSYGQNIWLHSMEVCCFASMLADEIGADYEVARIAGFTHDLGKALDLQIVTNEGYNKEIAAQLLDQNIANKLTGNEGHDLISKIIMEELKYPLDNELRARIVYALYCHHEAVPFKNTEDYLIKGSDAISSGRPGARQESFEWYLQRIKELEDLGASFEGVKKAFSVSAGRELRIIVDQEAVSDLETQDIASKTAEKIQLTLSYPGKIKVNAIRITEYNEKASLEKTLEKVAIA